MSGNHDLESGLYRRKNYDKDSDDGTFDSRRTKSDRFKRLWRQTTLVVNSSRWFRYKLDLKKEDERKQLVTRIRTHAQVIWAALLFKMAGQGKSASPTQVGDFGLSVGELVLMSKHHNVALLQRSGGVKGVVEKLKSDPEKGVVGDETDLTERKTAFGSNTYPKKKEWSFWRFVLEACCDTTLIIWMVATASSKALGIKTEGIKEGWYESIAIAVLIVIFFTVAAFSDYKQSLQFQNLSEEMPKSQMEVIRSGRRNKVFISDIVVGDVVCLHIGDQIPADGLVISSQSLSLDESSMNGESKFVHKDATRSPFIMSGCKVADGSATVLVTGVGINTKWGLLMASISKDKVRLNGVATYCWVVFVVTFVVWVIHVIRFFTGDTRNADGTVQFRAGRTSAGEAMVSFIQVSTNAVTTVVVTVPVGLSLAVKLMLSYSMGKMRADNALVTKLSACETIGCVTTICSDKTGILTQNQEMSVVESYVAGKKITPQDNKSLYPPGVVSLLIEAIAQNTSGEVFVPEGGGAMKVSGSPTEKAILHWGVNIGMDFTAVRSKSIRVHAFPFNSEKKRGGVALKLSDSEIRVHWKGAAEIVLVGCSSYIDADNRVTAMDEAKLSFFKKAIEDMAAERMSCVALAYKMCKAGTVPTRDEELDNWQLPEDELILLSIVGIKYPCCPGVKDAVQLCTNAGVRVRMVTGDNLQMAKAIALECGILASHADATEPTIIEGKSFRHMTVSQRLEVVDRILVMGRSSPNDKLFLVQALRKKGHVVAVTGDGTNDAPALHKANVGLAMGIQGTVVAKKNSDIIILDDNFVSVVKVVRWGRSLYANIQNFIQFQLTVNVAVLLITKFGGAVSPGNAPLSAVQHLWVNLIIMLGSLALATEAPTDHLMRRPPVRRREPLITNIMWRNLLIQVIYQVTVLLILHFAGLSILNLKHLPRDQAFRVRNTLIFNAFVLCQVFNEFNARKPDEINVWKGVTKNRLFMGIVGLEVVLQVLIIFFLGKFTDTVRLSWQLWIVSVVIGFISWPLAAVGKLIPVPERPLGEYLCSRSHKHSRHLNTWDINIVDT